jgi:cell division protease FtsH
MRLIYAIAIVAVIAVIAAPSLLSKSSAKSISYQSYLTQVQNKEVKSAQIDTTSGTITGTLDNGTSYTVSGPNPAVDSEYSALKAGNVKYTVVTPKSNPLTSILIYLLPVLLILGVFYFISRRAQGQMGSIMSIGRSKAKLYSSERPSTTFDDVAGYGGVKLDSKTSGPAYPRAFSWSVPPGRVRRCWPEPWPARPACRSCR